MKFEQPNSQFPTYRSRFLTVGDHMYVTVAHEPLAAHRRIADSDQLWDEIDWREIDDPASLDGGVMAVSRSRLTGVPQIYLFANATNPHLPVEGYAKEARIRSARLVLALCPDFEVAIKLGTEVINIADLTEEKAS